MTRILNGPAARQIMTLTRTPILLRLVVDTQGVWAALCQIGERARDGEEVHVYRRVGDGEYTYWTGHAPGYYLAINPVWQAWARLHCHTPSTP